MKRAVLGAALVALASCGDRGPAPDPQVVAAQDPSNIQRPLEGSWMLAAMRAPDAAKALWEAPGGAGWLALFHNDLDAAARGFADHDSPSARLGRARVHLARADAWRAAWQLHRRAAAAVADYRQQNRETVRRGDHEDALALVAAAASPSVPPRPWIEGAEQRTAKNPSGLSKPLAELARRRRLGVGGPPLDLPPQLALAEAFAAALSAGDLALAERIRPNLQPQLPQVVDALGEDPDAGLQFQLRFYDPELLRSLMRHELAQAWGEGAGLPQAGEPIAEAVRAAWGGELPEGIVKAARPAPRSAPLPRWGALFVAPVVDEADWIAWWSSADSPTLDPLAGGGDVDTLLARAATLRSRGPTFLREAAPGGESLLRDLHLGDRLADRYLRYEMMRLLAAGDAIGARRLGERSLDFTPGSLGGAADSRASRLSYRNDLGFLVRLTRCVWASGHADLALDYLYPLAERLPPLAGPKMALDQLAAAASVGQRGKASAL